MTVKLKNRTMGTTLTFLLLLASFCFCPGSAFGASGFTDVPENYWGASYIAFASEKGIINGYPQNDGTSTFAPENSVTMEEAAAMLYRAFSAAGMLASADDFQGEYQVTLDENKIASWARTYVAYGLEQGFIEESELADFTDDAGAGLPAVRMTPATWAAKALQMNFTSAYSLPYTDMVKISDGKLPYIDLLYRQGIMKGSLQTDGSVAFLPDMGIKRSEFAAIANRVYESLLLKQQGTYDLTKETISFRGTVVSADENQKRITIKSADGTEAKVIAFHPETQIVYNGNMVYNGLGGISPGQSLVIASLSLEQGMPQQVLIASGPRKQEGAIEEVKALSGEITRIGIKDASGNPVYYLKTIQTKADISVSKGKGVHFIADGVKLIEII